MVGRLLPLPPPHPHPQKGPMPASCPTVCTTCLAPPPQPPPPDIHPTPRPLPLPTAAYTRPASPVPHCCLPACLPPCHRRWWRWLGAALSGWCWGRATSPPLGPATWSRCGGVAVVVLIVVGLIVQAVLFPFGVRWEGGGGAVWLAMGVAWGGVLGQLQAVWSEQAAILLERCSSGRAGGCTAPPTMPQFAAVAQPLPVPPPLPMLLTPAPQHLPDPLTHPLSANTLPLSPIPHPRAHHCLPLHTGQRHCAGDGVPLRLQQAARPGGADGQRGGVPQ